MLQFILSLVLFLSPDQSIQQAIDSARTVYQASGETTTLRLSPGTYYEELTIDVPGLRLINDAPHPTIGLRNGGVDIDPHTVRISWYCGHGYQYASMGDQFNYGGSRMRRWNASVLVTAPDFYAENIIFENSFNQYVSAAELRDSMVDISQAKVDWTVNERPKRVMPVRPRVLGSTEVQQKRYMERAAAISFTSTATHATLENCRCVGHQDVLYGDSGASVYIHRGILQGGVDFIFGALCLAVDHATIVINVSAQHNDYCYISASRNPEGTRGMLFYGCHLRFATTDELVSPGNHPAYLARPWRWWGETVWAYTTWDKGCLNPTAWHTGLTKGKECPNSYEYRSQDKSRERPEWVHILRKPCLIDGTPIRVDNWR